MKILALAKFNYAQSLVDYKEALIVMKEGKNISSQVGAETINNKFDMAISQIKIGPMPGSF